MVIMTPQGVPFHPVLVIGLGKNLLFKSVLGHCDIIHIIWAIDRFICITQKFNQLHRKFLLQLVIDNQLHQKLSVQLVKFLGDADKSIYCPYDMYYVGSFIFEQSKGFYTKIAKIMIWVEIGWIGCLAGKSKGAPRNFFFSFIG